jgi:CheY-like chemotaxis protein
MPTILVVDDSQAERRLIGGLLQKSLNCKVEYAANGEEALAIMNQSAAELIVTDLAMPVMDGLELVAAVRHDFPDVPVILMTAYGNESLALEALEQGATSYVPKSQLTERLAETVEEVLAIVQADRSYEHLLACLSETEFRFVLENDPDLVDPLVDLVGRMATGMGVCDAAGRLQLGVALKEAMLNALFHGNLEITAEQTAEVQDMLIGEDDLSLVEQRRAEPPYRDRRIFVDVRISPAETRFVIRDQGAGFDHVSVPSPDDPGTLDGDRGRGMSLMYRFMDEVTYNQAGNEVTMVKRRAAAPNRAQADAG